MIPNPKYFPASLQERAAWYTNFNNVIQTEGASLGLTVPELASIAQDWEQLDYLANAAVTLDAYAEGVRTYRRIITEGDIGDPTPDFPTNITLSLPFTIATGLFERLDKYVKRIRAAAAYTDEIGALLGIIPASSGGATPEADLKPALKVAALPGNIVETRFTKGDSNGIRLEMQIDIETDWTVAGSFFKSPASIAIPANPGNLPRAVRLRARFLDGNEPVGQNSDTVNVTTNP